MAHVNDALSIGLAARECGQDIALLYQGQSYDFAALAKQVALVDSTRSVIRNSDPLQTLLHLYAALEFGRALCILPSHASDAEVANAAERMIGLDDDIALVLFSSGSEGHPKGVMLPRSALLASTHASAICHGWNEHDRWLCCLPLHHIGGLSVLLRCLTARKTAVLSDGFHTESVAKLLGEQEVTKVSLVPTMLWRLLETGHRAPASLRLVLIGGAALDPQLLSRATSAGYRVVHSYGMTETASQIIVMGRPLEGVQLRIRDQLLEVRGPMLMRGYLPPDDSEQVIVDSWFRTNDRARIDEDGRIEILGRSDWVIISGGENIDPSLIEAALCQCSGVRAALAIGLPHPEWGQELVALVVREAGDETALRAALADRLAYHLQPKHLFSIDALPLLANGKLDRRKAIEIARARRGW